MIARGFRPVVWVFMIGAAVLVCYMLNLRVAAERAELARLDRRIVATQQNIRALQTEVGTRSRIPQLEQWNQDVLALSAPVTGQYLQRDVSLARFDTRQPQLSDQTAEVRMASAETEGTPAATPAPQHAVAAPVAAAPVAAGQPQVRRASLLVAPDAPASAKPQGAAERPRREAERVVRIAARDEIRPGPREARARPASHDERRAPPARTAARETPRPGPARVTTRTAAAPARGAAGHVLAAPRPGRELRKDTDRRRGNRD